MTVTCECGAIVIIKSAPTFGQTNLSIECTECGRSYSAMPGPDLGALLPVCEGYPWLAEGTKVVQLRPGEVVPLRRSRKILHLPAGRSW